MKCPRDSADLQACGDNPENSFFCPVCKGYFIKLDERNDITLSTAVLKPLSRRKVPVSIGNKIISPISGDAMLVFKYRGIQIDYCSSSNSVWLDKGELEKIVSKSKRGKSQSASSEILPGIEAGLLVNSDGIFGFLGDAISGLFGSA